MESLLPAQLKSESIIQAQFIREELGKLEGADMGQGFIFNSGTLTPSYNRETSPYILDADGQPQTFYHYRNLSTSPRSATTEFHDLMHFGSHRAAHSRAFSKRLLDSGKQFSESLLNSDIFNRCAHNPISADSEFGSEVMIAARIKSNSPYFIPDIGQTQYFQNRAVLYACGLFEEAEVDRDLFDQDGFPQRDIDEKVMNRLRERGHDAIGYLNDIEDPGSLSLIILDKAQAESVSSESNQFPGFRYRFGSLGSEQIIECDPLRNVRIRAEQGPSSVLV